MNFVASSIGLKRVDCIFHFAPCISVSYVLKFIMYLNRAYRCQFSKVIQKNTVVCVFLLNPFKPSVLFYLNLLDRSISNRRGV